MIRIDIEKAKDVWRDKLREARAPVLKQLDVEFQRALEQNANTASIVEQKQQLRDITKHPMLEAATTVEEIKTVWPEILSSK